MAVASMKRNICDVCGMDAPYDQSCCPECGASFPVPLVPKEATPNKGGMVREVMLECTLGSSNKEYHLQLFHDGVEFVVCAAWGPRGRLSQRQEKKRTPHLSLAEKAYDQLLAQKKQKGYEIEWDKEY